MGPISQGDMSILVAVLTAELEELPALYVVGESSSTQPEGPTCSKVASGFQTPK